MDQGGIWVDKPTNKQLTRTKFSPGIAEKLRRRICEKQRVQATVKGYTNLVDHLHRAYSSVTINSTYQHILRYGTTASVVGVTTHAKGIHDWFEWVVMENRPLSVCGSEITRKNMTVPVTNSKALKKYMSVLVEVVRSELKDNVAEKRLELVFDGWSENGYHFIGTFVVMQPDDPSKATGREMYLLSFKPHKTRHFGADATIDLFDDLLDQYSIDASQLCSFVGDNASVNVSIGKKVKIHLVGCASHRLHLAPEKHLQPFTELLDKVASAMKCLRMGKQRAVLREEDLLMPALRNDTRWSSTFAMLKRYLELVSHLDDSDADLAPLLLSAEEKNCLRALLNDLKTKLNPLARSSNMNVDLHSVLYVFPSINCSANPQSHVSATLPQMFMWWAFHTSRTAQSRS